MAEQPNHRFRVAISGGGIGGLALAAFICFHAKDVSVDIYESKPEISSIGTGIAIWKRTWQTLQDIGLDEEIQKRNLPMPSDGEGRGPIFRKADQPVEGIDFHNHMMPYGPVLIARPILLDMLQSRLSDLCTIHRSTQVVSYAESVDGSIIIKLKDGSTREADVLIGCDGMRSATRAVLFKNLAESDPSKGYEKYIEPIWSGCVAYRGTADRNELREESPTNVALDQLRLWCGKTKHAVTNPTGDIINFACFYHDEDSFGKPYNDPWVVDVPVQELVDCYTGWEPDFIELISMAQKLSRWAIHVVDALPLIVSGHVGLLGDAAHAMTPHQGIGGGQAIEDAHMLGRLLASPKANKSNLRKVLQIYQELRVPHTKLAAERSWSNGLLYQFIHPDYPVKLDATAEELEPLGQAVGATFEWLAVGGCDEDWAKAESLLDGV